jgi:hypothetical protein
VYFQQALDQSGGVDFEAGRLQGQVLMEIGRYKEAAEALLRVLPLKPTDSVGLGESLTHYITISFTHSLTR